ncbi:MAG: STAS-like domain-containing protein [Gammaproteobacteria bacterium]
MTKVRSRGEQIRRFIVSHVDKHPTDIAKFAAEHFGITRQAVNKHLQRLVEERVLVSDGKTRNRAYRLYPLVQWLKPYELNESLAEDIVWRSDVEPRLGQLPENIRDIWHYGFTEMLNNAIDHAEGTSVDVLLSKNAAVTELAIVDNGIGIFRKIQGELGLVDERHAILELSKGKLTTDPAKHTGEGIFFTSRMFDAFDILSGGVYFSHTFGDAEDWILERVRPESGTLVWMELHNHTSRTINKVFGQFTSDDGFTKTVVPVRLAQYGDDKLVSRSQAKRFLAGLDRFKTVIFDFTEVESIGQAFADQVFRVFASRHPELELMAIKANSAVKRMIQRVKAAT